MEKNELLCKAAKNGNLEEVKSLIESGADVHFEKDNALRLAAINGNFDVVEFLIFEAGANVYNSGALKYAAEYGHLEIVKFLVFKTGANVHDDDDNILGWAAWNGHLDVIEFLIYAGMDPHINDNYVLRIASRKEHLSVIKLIRDYGEKKMEKKISVIDFNTGYESLEKEFCNMPEKIGVRKNMQMNIPINSQKNNKWTRRFDSTRSISSKKRSLERK